MPSEGRGLELRHVFSFSATSAAGQCMFVCQNCLCANLAKYVTKPEAAEQPVNLPRSRTGIAKPGDGCRAAGRMSSGLHPTSQGAAQQCHIRRLLLPSPYLREEATKPTKDEEAARSTQSRAGTRLGAALQARSGRCRAATPVPPPCHPRALPVTLAAPRTGRACGRRLGSLLVF